jgi:phytoene dehydrogenase-like protein
MSSAGERVVIVGGGHNGLVAAFYLARAGLAPLVFERREMVGGVAVNVHPGFRSPAVIHTTNPFLEPIARDLQLERNGLVTSKSEMRVFAANPNGPPLRIYNDPARTAQELPRVSFEFCEHRSVTPAFTAANASGYQKPHAVGSVEFRQTRFEVPRPQPD